MNLNTVQNTSVKRPRSNFVLLGAWHLPENEDGDLEIWNIETSQRLILAIREES